MLGSITPLGERGRGSRWGVTVSAYLIGSLAGGAALGAVLGWIGSPLEMSASFRLVLLGTATAVGIASDLGLGGLRIPSTHRQVDETWRASYRGWVWGLAFGAQLALGVVTVVMTAFVYVTWLGAVLAGSVATGAVIGLAFGLARAVPILTVARVRTSGQLLGVDRTLQRLAAPARRLTVAAGASIAAVALLGAAR
ncbi:MAG TPA: sulfite exporter TauE/SafE family protein [Actinomycetota bacterium]|nr:sulfite exporter TauE/SafE family protein [Actinomycetota bacterium]